MSSHPHNNWQLSVGVSAAVCLCLWGNAASAQNLLPGWQEQYSVELRGGLERSNSGFEHIITITPEVRLLREADGQTYEFDAAAEIDQTGTDAVRINSIGIGGTAGMRLSRNSSASVSARYGIGQARPSDPDTPTGVAQSGHTQELQVGGAYEQQFGRFTGSLRGGFGRYQQANSLLADNSYQSNADQNYWGSQVGGRLSYQFTPRLAAFIDAELSKQIYDAASTSLSAKRDNWTFETRLGGTYTLNEQISAEASVGMALQDYDDASLADLRLYSFDASANWQISPSGVVTLSYGTELNPTQRVGEVMEIQDTAQLSYAHRFNNQWSASASTSLETRKYQQTSAEVKTFGAALGVDYQINSDLSAFANYSYSLREETAVAPERRHRIEAGLRFSRP